MTRLTCLNLMMLWGFVAPALGGTCGGGSGTAEDPYLIYTAEQMNAIGANPTDWQMPLRHRILAFSSKNSLHIGNDQGIILI